MIQTKNTPPYYTQGIHVKNFTGRISQAATNPPVNLIHQNTLGQLITWTRLGTGYYRGVAPGAFPVLNTWINLSQYGDSTGTLTQVYIVDEDTIELVNLTNGTNNDGMIINIEIRVYDTNAPF